MKRRRSGSLGMIAWWWALYSQICIFTHLSFLSVSSKTGEHEVNALWEGRHLVCTRGSLTYSSLHARILYLTVASGLLYFVFPESTWAQGSSKKRSWHNVFTHLTSVDITSSHITSSHFASSDHLLFLFCFTHGFSLLYYIYLASLIESSVYCLTVCAHVHIVDYCRLGADYVLCKLLGTWDIDACSGSSVGEMIKRPAWVVSACVRKWAWTLLAPHPTPPQPHPTPVTIDESNVCWDESENVWNAIKPCVRRWVSFVCADEVPTLCGRTKYPGKNNDKRSISAKKLRADTNKKLQGVCQRQTTVEETRLRKLLPWEVNDKLEPLGDLSFDGPAQLLQQLDAVRWLALTFPGRLIRAGSCWLNAKFDIAYFTWT